MIRKCIYPLHIHIFLFIHSYTSIAPSTAKYLHFVGRATLCPLVIDVLDHAFLNMLGILIGHQANGELANDLLGYDSLGARLIEGALDAMDGQTGITPSGLQQARLISIMGQVVDANVFPRGSD